MDEFWNDLDLSSPGKWIRAILISVIAGLILKGVGKAYPPVSRWLLDNAQRMLAVAIAASLLAQAYCATFLPENHSMTMHIFERLGWWASEVFVPLLYAASTGMFAVLLILFGGRLSNLITVFLMIATAMTTAWMAYHGLADYPLQTRIWAGMWLYILVYWSIIVIMMVASSIAIVSAVDADRNRTASA